MKHFIILLFIPLLSTWANCQTVWLDADTGNEMDDLYAIARLTPIRTWQVFLFY